MHRILRISILEIAIRSDFINRLRQMEFPVDPTGNNFSFWVRFWLGLKNFTF